LIPSERSSKVKVLVEKAVWPWKLTCRKCESVLEAEKTDVEYAWFGASYGGDRREKEYYVTCPVCETDNFVPKDLLTQSVKDAAKAYQQPT